MQARTFSDPIDMPVTVHHDHSVCQMPQPTNEPIAVNQGRADTLCECLPCPRIFNEMVVQTNDPAAARILRCGNFDPGSCSAEIIPSALVNENCVSTFEFSKMNPEAVVRIWRHNHREGPAPEVRERFRHQRPSGIGELDHIS